MLDTLTYQLLTLPSISPDDHGCQKLLAEALAPLNFKIQQLDFGDVKNLWAKLGDKQKTLLFVGHTDVVPPGPIDQWKFDPFIPTIENGKLYARGAADMKIAIACMVEACRRFLKENPEPNFNIAFLITSCEEANTDDGTEKAIKVLIEENHERIDWCIVGEPSSDRILGDQIKVGRRGSLHGELTIHGKQGHIAYPHLAQNPIHLIASALKELTEAQWDNGTEYFQPTSFQISNIHSGTGATNVIPNDLQLVFNFRYSPASTVENLQKTVEALLEKHHLNYTITWQHTSKCFMSSLDILHDALQKSIEAITGSRAKTSTTGGTSDGRFIAPHGIETIECGFPNGTIHQVNECIEVDDIEILTQIYYATLINLL
ncbi:MAG: succinyl-diaminopimelate desuccinylase [Pseudomonadota bacterium]